LRRIFVEKGLDFFDRSQVGQLAEQLLPTQAGDAPDPLDSSHGDINPPVMTVEELQKMRLEILPQLL